MAPAGSNLPEAVLTEFFRGPTAEEAEQGLAAITSGATGFQALRIDEDGVAYVTLEGPCSSMGATYTIAQPLMKNLRQFPDIDYVKIYDAEGQTGQPEGLSDSIPFCLEP
jgi:Fe-S cluster biogenesis protein NfuA